MLIYVTRRDTKQPLTCNKLLTVDVPSIYQTMTHIVLVPFATDAFGPLLVAFAALLALLVVPFVGLLVFLGDMLLPARIFVFLKFKRSKLFIYTVI